MIEVNVHIDIERPPAEVFDYWADWTNNPAWQKGMERCETTSEPPRRVGSTYDQHAKFLGRPIVLVVRSRRVRTGIEPADQDDEEHAAARYHEIDRGDRLGWVVAPRTDPG